LRRRQLFRPNQPQDRGLCDPENLTRFTHEHFAASLPFSLTVDRNPVMVAHAADTLRRPYFAMCRAALVAIQDGGDSLVWFHPRQRANDLHQILVQNIAMFADTNLLELYLSMISSLPMQHEPYGFAFARGNDVLQCDAQQSFLVLRRTARIVPKPGEVPRELQ